MGSGITISHRHCAGDELGEILQLAQAAVDEFAVAHTLDTVTRHRIAIIVEEIVTNVLCHAEHDRAIGLTLQLHHGAEGLLVTLEDDSFPFDPRLVSQPKLPNAERGGGVGLALVKAWTEIISYESEMGRNRLILQVRPHSSPTG